MLAAVLFVARVELDVTVPGPLVLEESQTEVAAERHLVAVRLSVSKMEQIKFINCPCNSFLVWSCPVRRKKK